MPDRKKRKWREGAVFLLILLLTASLAWSILSRWKRTAHIYAYDEGLNIKEEEQLAQNSPNETEDEEIPPEETIPPQDQDDSSEQTDPEMDDPENREQRQDQDDDPEDSDDGKPSDDTSDDGDKHTGDDGEPGGDEGMGGDGEPEGSNAPEGNGEPAPSPVPPAGTASAGTPPAEPSGTSPAIPTGTPKESAPPSEAPADKVASLLCEWPDKDSIRYNGTIPKDTIQVTAVYESGKKVKLTSGDYSIIGLSSDSVGTHSLKIAYGEVLGTLRYTVKNWAESISVSWAESKRMHCCKGENVKEEILVTVNMADKQTIELEDEDYTITGIDNEKTGVDQTYQIQYEEFTKTGTCRFYEQKITYIDKYYDGDTLLDTVETDATGTLKYEDDIVDESKKPGVAATRNGHDYTLSSTQLIADGKERKFNSGVDENDLPTWNISRVFDIQIIREYQMMS